MESRRGKRYVKERGGEGERKGERDGERERGKRYIKEREGVCG